MIVGIGSMRSGPVYGKLDFLLLNGRPWWRPWRPMINAVLRKGTQPILSDMMTSSVMRGVFSQKTLLFRFDRRYAPADVEVFSRLNRPRLTCSLLPVGALYLLLTNREKNMDKSCELTRITGKKRMIKMFAGIADLQGKGRRSCQNDMPYRCVINLRGFPPSWVAEESGHWSKWFSYTSSLYRYQGVKGRQLEFLLREYPPKNCMVFFDN